MPDHSFNLEKINVVVTEAVDRLKKARQEIVGQEIHKILVELNKHLSKPLIGFAVYGMTPEWNDGEVCEHNSDYGVPHIDFNEENGYAQVFDEIFENSTVYKAFFVDDPTPYDDAYEHACGVGKGLAFPIIVYKNDNEKELISRALRGIDALIEMWLTTNYMVIAKYDVVTQQYNLKVTEVDPDY